MAVRSVTAVFLLLLVVVSIYVSHAAESSEKEVTNEKKSKKEKVSPVDPNAVFVQSIGQNNWLGISQSDTPFLIEFFAPWCGQCKKVAPEYSKAAAKFLKTGKIGFGKIDGTKESQLLKQFKVTSYPTFFLIKKGAVLSPYKGEVSVAAIGEFLQKELKLDLLGPAVVQLENGVDVSKFEKDQHVRCVGFFKEFKGSAYSAFVEAAGQMREQLDWYATIDPAAIEAAGVKAPAVIMYRDFEAPQVRFKGMYFTAPNIVDWAVDRSIPIVGIINEKNSRTYLDRKKGVFCAFSNITDVEQVAEARKILEAAADDEHRKKYSFAIADGIAFASIVRSMGLDAKSLPQYVFDGIHVADRPTYAFHKDRQGTSPEAIHAFLESVHNGKVLTRTEQDTLDAQEPEGSDVISFNDDNFKPTVERSPLVVAQWMAPWSADCKEVRHWFRKLAAEYKSEGIVFGKIDVSQPMLLNQETQSSTPWFSLYKKGKKITEAMDHSQLSEANVRAYIDKFRYKDPVIVEDLDAFVSDFKHGPPVIGFGFNTDSKKIRRAKKAYFRVADETRGFYRYGQVVDQPVLEAAMTKYGFSEKDLPILVAYDSDKMSAVFDHKQRKMRFDDIGAWLKMLRIPRVVTVTSATSKQVVDAKVPLLIVFLNAKGYENDTDKTDSPMYHKFQWKEHEKLVADAFEPEFKGKIIFTIADYDEWNQVALRMQMVPKLAPAVAIDARAEKSLEFYPHRGIRTLKDFTTESIRQFAREFLAGKAQPGRRSAAVPASNDEAVKVVVGRTWEEIIEDPTKHVILEVYAPWCNYCKKLAPIWAELGNLIADDESLSKHFLVTKMDGTENDTKKPITVEGFPTVLYFPKGNKSNPVKCFERDARSILRFMKANVDNMGLEDSSKMDVGSALKPSKAHDEL